MSKVKKSKASFVVSGMGSFVEKEAEILYAKDHQKKDENISENISRIKENYQQKTTSSITTIFAVVNTMVGTVVLLIPVNFGSSGILLSLGIMLFIGAISYKTCSWLVRNTLDTEDDVGQVVQRILGPKWQILCQCSSATILFIVGIVYFLLINQTMWQILLFIFENSKFKNYAPATEITFSKFSTQWQAVILMPILFPLFFIKKMSIIVKCAGYGAIAMYIYMAFILYIFFDNVAHDRITPNLKNLNLVSTDLSVIANIIGNFALAFQIHNSITAIMSTNAKKENNVRDLSIAFAITCFVYGSIGIFGSFGLLGRKPQVPNPTIIYDYFEPTDISSFIVEVAFLANLLTVYPIFPFISKAQFFYVFFQQRPTPKWAYVGLNVIFAILCLVVQIFLINVNYVIGVGGTVIGFLIIYLFPIQIRLKELHGEIVKRPNDQSLKTIQEVMVDDETLQYLHRNSKGNGVNETLISQTETIEMPHLHSKNYKIFIYVLISFFSLVGLFCAVVSLIGMF